MKVAEILYEMSVPRKKAEVIVTGLEQQINLHLLKLLGMQANDETRDHWKQEVDTWLFRISALSIKPDNKPIPTKTIFKWLFDEPFGDTKKENIRNITTMLAYLEKQKYMRNAVSEKDIAIQLLDIHKRLAECLSKHDNGEHIIGAL